MLPDYVRANVSNGLQQHIVCCLSPRTQRSGQNHHLLTLRVTGPPPRGDNDRLQRPLPFPLRRERHRGRCLQKCKRDTKLESCRICLQQLLPNFNRCLGRQDKQVLVNRGIDTADAPSCTDKEGPLTMEDGFRVRPHMQNPSWKYHCMLCMTAQLDMQGCA